jgi:tetratricopeptide (TPR) repeat protein
MRRAARRHTIVSGALAAAALIGGSLSASAQETAPTGVQPLRPPVLVVDDLLGADWKAARAAQDELRRIGARAIPPLLRARAAAPARRSTRARIDEALRGIVEQLAAEVGAPLDDPAIRVAADAALGGLAGACDRDRPDLSVPPVKVEELGDAGSIAAPPERDWLGKRARARQARGALVALGPGVCGPLLAVPPVRPPEHSAVLVFVVQRLYVAERARLLAADAAGREAFRAGYRGLADLAAPLVAAGVRDEDATVRATYQAIRDEALSAGLAALDDPDPDLRGGAEDALLALEGLARPALERIARGDDPARQGVQVKDDAARLARWIRYGLDQELVRRLGDDLADYEALDYRARRARVFELERLGGAQAIPALRALLHEEPSDELRAMAALALFRQGDSTGAEWLAVHGAGIPLIKMSKRDLSAIYMDQGLRYLTLGKFERAEHEFKEVLALEPNNEVAWYNLACTYSRWGKLDLAFEHLRKAVEFGFDDASHMDDDKDLDPLRGDPRYKEIIDGIRAKRGGSQ